MVGQSKMPFLMSTGEAFPALTHTEPQSTYTQSGPPHRGFAESSCHRWLDCLPPPQIVGKSNMPSSRTPGLTLRIR